MKGKFIVIEGLDGCGKSTQVRLLQQKLEADGTAHRFIHFPMLNQGVYGNLTAEFLRGEFGSLEEVHPKLVALLFANDRLEHIGIIREWLDKGYCVLADRYVYSNVAFQCAKLKAEENTADVEKIGMTDAVRLLEEANESFNALYSSRSIDLLNRTTSETMKTIRPKVDEAFKALVSAINAVYQVNELVTKSPETKKELGGVIKQINGHLVQLQQILIRAGVIKSDVADEETVIPTPEEPVTPEITKFYPKENANPDKPLDFPRNKTAVLEGKGLKLVDSPEGKKAQLVLINYVDQRMPHEDSAILLNTDEKIEFTMMYDAAEGQYNFQIETYPNGTEEVVIIKYPETITLV